MPKEFQVGSKIRKLLTGELTGDLTGDLADNHIARIVGCSGTTVSSVRHELGHFPETVIGADLTRRPGPKPLGNRSGAVRSAKGRAKLRRKEPDLAVLAWDLVDLLSKDMAVMERLIPGLSACVDALKATLPRRGR